MTTEIIPLLAFRFAHCSALHLGLVLALAGCSSSSESADGSFDTWDSNIHRFDASGITPVFDVPNGEIVALGRVR